jgi:hypothetical protein
MVTVTVGADAVGVMLMLLLLPWLPVSIVIIIIEAGVVKAFEAATTIALTEVVDGSIEGAALMC